jgi:serine/threonine protein kinase
MDFCNGGELFYHLRKDKKFSEKRACFYAAQMIEAIRCLHMQEIIYRDLKPENVLLDSDGNLKITDFGLSK